MHFPSSPSSHAAAATLDCPDVTQPRPNLFIVGAQKSGTTSLHSALSGHPDIFMSDPKEPGFFVPVHGRPQCVYGAAASETEYLRVYMSLFQDAGGFRYIGEASTAYTMVPTYASSAPAIHAFCPAARIIYIMRDPVERTLSHYWWNFQHTDERRPPLRAIIEDAQYLGFSDYARQLRPYLELFSRDQIWWLTTEALCSQFEVELARILNWLDLDVSLQRTSRAPRENVTPQVVVQLRSQTLQHLRNSRGYGLLRRVIPQPLRKLASRMNEVHCDRSRANLQEVISYLRPRQRQQVEELSALLGSKFPEWTTLHAD